MDADKKILLLSLEAVTEQLNNLLVACTDDKGKPVAPTMKVISQSRASLPNTYSMSFNSKKR